MSSEDTITYGPIRLLVTDLQRSTAFWEQVIGLHVRSSADVVELGTADATLVVLEEGAYSGFMAGYSGLYHVAIHVPTEPDFALILARLMSLGWSISPTDHIMSKAIYLMDPDGITIEITLETPERFDRYNMQDGRFQVIDAKGNVRGATEPLDTEPILALLHEPDLSQPLPDATRIGHVHMYVADLTKAYRFYEQLGFEDNLLSESIGFADLSAGGDFKHRMAMNTWQSKGAPQAPNGTAGMVYATIRYAEQDLLERVVKNLHDVERIGDAYRAHDPSGNVLRLEVLS